MASLARGSAPKALSLKQLRERQAEQLSTHPSVWRRDETAPADADFERHVDEALALAATALAPVIDIAKWRKR